jgi:hypothetical protein
MYAGAGTLAILRNHYRDVLGNGWSAPPRPLSAFYQDHAAVFAIDTLECLAGSVPKPQQRLVEAWAEIHGAELQHDWDLLQSGQPPIKIDPLR